jgi:hypothetical protein
LLLIGVGFLRGSVSRKLAYALIVPWTVLYEGIEIFMQKARKPRNQRPQSEQDTRVVGRSSNKAERNVGMYDQWKGGLTLAAIGRDFDLTPEKVRLIVREPLIKRPLWKRVQVSGADDLISGRDCAD